MSESQVKEFTREEYIYLSKLYEKAERYPDMLKAITKMIIINPNLTKEECDILSTGYKCMITDKRNSWRILNSMERRERKKKSDNIPNIKEIKSHIEKEIRDICKELQNLVDTYLIPNVNDHENEIYFHKLKADYYRYICEFAEGNEKEVSFSVNKVVIASEEPKEEEKEEPKEEKTEETSTEENTDQNENSETEDDHTAEEHIDIPDGGGAL